MIFCKFKTRFHEHVSDTKYNKVKTALSRVKQEESVVVHSDQAKLIKHM